MKRIVRGIFPWLMLLSLDSCSRSHRSHHDEQNNDGDSRDEALELGGQEGDNFRAWRQSLVKSCDTSEIFDGKSSGMEMPSFDARRWLEENHESLALKGGNGEFIYLGFPTSPSGNLESKLERSLSINGSSNNFSARATRNGKECVVEIAGKEVFRTELWATLPVVLFGHGNIAKPAETVMPYDAGFAAKSFGNGIYRAMDAVVSEDERAQLNTFLATKFPTLTPSQLAAMFPTSGLGAGQDVAWLERDGASVMFNEADVMLAGASELMASLEESQGSVPVRLWIRAPRVTSGDASNSSDPDLWGASMVIHWHANGARQRSFAANDLQLAQDSAFDHEQFRHCLANRDRFFTGSEHFGNGPFSPSFMALTGPCQVLVRDLAEALDSDRSFLDRIKVLMANVKGTPGLNLNGWQYPIQLLNKFYLPQKLQLSAKLANGDSAFESPLISSLESFSASIARAMENSGAMTDLREELLDRLAWRWASQGTAMADEQIAKLVGAIANVRDILPTSTSKWIESLGVDPRDKDDIQSYAFSVDAEQKKALAKLQSQAEAIHVGSQLDEIKLASILQRREDLANLALWNEVLADLTQFHDRDLARAPTSGLARLTFDSDFSTLVSPALREDWRNEQWQQVEALAVLAKQQLMCKDALTVSKQASCAGQEYFSRRDAKLLAPAFGSRYVTFAGQLQEKLGALTEFSRSNIRTEVSRQFYAPIWAACDNGRFQQNAQGLLSLLGRLAKADFFESNKIEREIRAKMDDCH